MSRIKRTIDELKNLNFGFSTLSVEQLQPRKVVDRETSEQVDPILTEIFAPDPVTGIPRSDCYYVMSKDKNPVISQYINDVLMQSHSNVSPALGSADDALLTVKTASVSVEDYKKNLKSLLVYENK